MAVNLGHEIESSLPRAYRLALALTARAADAEDAVGDAVADLLSHPSRWDRSRPFFPYFARCVASAASRARRTEARRAVREEGLAMMLKGSRAACPGLSEDSAAALRRAMGGLEPEVRSAVLLVCAEGLSQTETGEVLGVPQTTVASRVKRGLEQLRAELLTAGLAGLAATPLTAVLASLPCEPAPAALTAKIGAMIGAAGKGTAMTGAKAATAAKGGIAMKVVLGVVLAGALAGGTAVLSSWFRVPGSGLGAQPGTRNHEPGTVLAAPPAPMQGPPQSAHYAAAAWWDYLDGPRLGSMIMAHRTSMCDDQDNLYLLTAFAVPALRCVRANGMVETITGDDRPLNDLGLSEGPAAFLPRLSAYGGFGSIASWMSVQGAPYDGEDKGALYVGATGGGAFKVFRNKARNGRWWFKRLAFAELKRPFQVRVESDGSLGIVCDGSYYRCDAAKGTLTPMLNFADYTAYVDRVTKKKVAPGTILRADDGTFYLWCQGDGIYRIPPDKSKCEQVLLWRGANGHPREPVFDGPGMTPGVADFFDGPYLMGYRPPHTLFVSAVDDGFLRRWRDGRVSTWSARDGEWHETAGRPKEGWFYGFCVGPRGSNYAYNTYSGQCRDGDDRIFKVGPIDFDKATVGPLVGGQ